MGKRSEKKKWRGKKKKKEGKNKKREKKTRGKQKKESNKEEEQLFTKETGTSECRFQAFWNLISSCPQCFAFKVVKNKKMLKIRKW